MLEKRHDALLPNGDILFFDEYFSKVTLFATEVGILAVNLDKINLDDDNNIYEDDLETIVHVRFLTCRNKFEKHKSFKTEISKELMPVS